MGQKLPDFPANRWADAMAPTLDDFAAMARDALRELPEPFADLEEIEAASENELQDILLAYVQLEMSKLLGLNSSQLLEVDLSLVEMGMDSLMAIELKNRLQTHLGISFPITLAFEYPTIRKLSEYLYQEVMRRESIENNDSNLPKFDKREIVKDRQNYQTDVEKTERRRGAL
ncbi:hypothetical protein H1P_1960002 [Hyella patelloides LEGE 07179]|uniref:Carrier domain-containing protein n=1 Tax=Hyella patelloides LEGE 07179 TaxID=945734 RepID=A0A563VPH1_9CYAN|nr:acyl carrier protein [Hyella patelloides]VEP13356.1 hypothetical protein H1P_1960002 [Hyella patelloides LEGE 07179]